MVWIVALLYVIAAVLPCVGLVRLFLAARREAKALDGFIPNSYGFVQTALPILTGQIVRRPHNVIADFLFIGGGVAIGVAASIWSLFLP